MDAPIKISLAAARVNANLTQAETSKKMKVSKQTIVNWENGKTEPSVSQFSKLCDIYQIPMNYIFLP